MTAARTIPILVSAGTLALCLAVPAQAQSFRNLPIDRQTNVNAVQLACTGVGNREEQEARWNNYPVKLETVGDHGQYLAGEKVTLRRRDGARIMQVKCDAPWVMMRLDPGRYSATVEGPNGTVKNISLRVPDNGAQRDVVVRFPAQSASSGHGVMLPSG